MLSVGECGPRMMWTRFNVEFLANGVVGAVFECEEIEEGLAGAFVGHFERAVVLDFQTKILVFDRAMIRRHRTEIARRAVEWLDDECCVTERRYLDPSGD